VNSLASLPQLDGGLFLTDGGLETTLIFHRGIELPQFAAFVLLDDVDGERTLREYYEPYFALAAEHEAGLILETPTWRASPRWAAALGYSATQLDRLNRRAVELLAEMRDSHASRVRGPIMITGVVGPQDDGYNPSELISAADAERYHATQIASFAGTAADFVTVLTMTYAEEPIGITRAAAAAGLPVVISFTLGTDGHLPSGPPLAEGIERVDAETDGGPAYFMINCAHPVHFESVLDPEAPWAARICGVLANASIKSHAELDQAEELDDGDPEDLGERYAALAEKLPNLNVLGGCCGTDDRHVAAIGAAWRRAGR
jgi:S-methylmethionine-dependent homocysteine/selenocysteine methylase